MGKHKKRTRQAYMKRLKRRKKEKYLQEQELEKANAENEPEPEPTEQQQQQATGIQPWDSYKRDPLYVGMLQYNKYKNKFKGIERTASFDNCNRNFVR